MSKIIDRIQSNFSSVYITLLSIVVAFAFSDLINIVRNLEEIWSLSPSSITLWIQVAYAGLAPIIAWVPLSHIAMTRRSVPYARDTLAVFVVFAYLFLLNSAVGAEPEMWFFSIAGYKFLGLLNLVEVGTFVSKEEPELIGFRVALSWKGPLLYNVLSIGLGLVCGLLSLLGLLAASAETFLMGVAFVLLVLWLRRAYGAWSQLVREWSAA